MPNSLRPPLSRRGLLAAALPPTVALLPTPARAQTAAPPATTPLTAVAANGVRLSGTYRDHLQGICTNGRDTIYWSMTTRLAITDVYGSVIHEIPVAYHHGDLCYLDGKLYVAVNLALFNDPQKRSDSWIYTYDAGSLALLGKQRVAEVVYGAGGIAFADGRFAVVGGLPTALQENHVYEYDRNLKFVREVALPTGQTRLGIQTAAYNAGHWWFGCYGNPEVLLKVDAAYKRIQKFTFNGSLGLAPIDGELFLVGHGACSRDNHCVASLVPARLDAWIAKGILKPVG